MEYSGHWILCGAALRNAGDGSLARCGSLPLDYFLYWITEISLSLVASIAEPEERDQDGCQ